MDQESISIGFYKIKTTFTLIESSGDSPETGRPLQIPGKSDFFQFSSISGNPQTRSTRALRRSLQLQVQPTQLFSEITIDILHDANSEDVTFRISRAQINQSVINWTDFKFATVSIKFLKPTCLSILSLSDEEHAENFSPVYTCRLGSPCKVSQCPCQPNELCLRGYLGPFTTLQGYFETDTDDNPLSVMFEGETKVPTITGLVSVDFSIKEPCTPCTTEAMLKKIRDDYLNEPTKRILSEGLHTDFVLECDGKEFPCHKSILAAHSDVFAAAFTTPMSERDSDRMEIEDMFPRSLDAFLKYLYYGDTTAPLANVEIAFDLLRAGHKYQIEHVEKVASSIISMGEYSKFDLATTLALFAFCCKVERFKDLKKIAVAVLKRRANELVKLYEFDELLSQEPSVAKDLFKEISIH